MDTSRFPEFRRIQEDLRSRVILEPLRGTPGRIASVDLHVSREGSQGYAAAVLVNDTGEQIDQYIVRSTIDVPYVPGFLSFREMPLCRDAILGLPTIPDLILVDGQGLAHPRRFGLACHLGVELDLPSIGAAKSRLAGEAPEPAEERGATSPLMLGDEQVGMVVRTRTGVKPLFVSPGHRITIDDAVEWTLRLTSRYRQPDALRTAHRLAKQAASEHRA